MKAGNERRVAVRASRSPTGNFRFAQRAADLRALQNFVGLGAKMVARDGVEVGAGDADHPGHLRVRGGVDEAGRIGLGLSRAERVCLSFIRTTLSSLAGLTRRHSVISVTPRAVP